MFSFLSHIPLQSIFTPFLNKLTTKIFYNSILKIHNCLSWNIILMVDTIQIQLFFTFVLSIAMVSKLLRITSVIFRLFLMFEKIQTLFSTKVKSTVRVSPTRHILVSIWLVTVTTENNIIKNIYLGGKWKAFILTRSR